MKRATTKKIASMPFERALALLRRGKLMRRRAWQQGSFIFRIGDKVFLKLPDTFKQDGLPVGATMGNPAGYGSRPDWWKPYPQDFFATDWERVK